MASLAKASGSRFVHVAHFRTELLVESEDWHFLPVVAFWVKHFYGSFSFLNPESDRGEGSG